MKKFFTLVFATLMATNMMAQMPGAMKFAGASTMSVAGSSFENASDTIQFAMKGMTSGDIVMPALSTANMGTIPSFTIENVSFSMGANHVVTMPEQTFSATVNVNGEEKQIKGSAVSGTYNMADNSLSITAVFQYGRMPMALTYNVKSYYVKDVTSAITVSVGGTYNYENVGVTYQVRKYMDGDVEKVDVEIPTYQLENTVMGNLTLGSYIVKGLTFDEEKGGYYRDYKNDGLKFHFTAVSNGNTSMDADYEFNASKDNNILVKYEGSKIVAIDNHFQMGAMPFPISSSFKTTSTGIQDVKAEQKQGNDKVYNLSGQVVGKDYKGIVIKNGKKYLMK